MSLVNLLNTYLLTLKDRLITKLKLEKGGRSQSIFKNIILSFIVKGGAILSGIAIVSLTVDYISKVEYGIWLTISSIITWISFFDIGMGNGLRNKVTSCLSNNEHEKARDYISITYFTLLSVSVLIGLVFSLLNWYIDWRNMLNIPNIIKDDIHILFVIVCLSFCAQFVIQNINNILIATHQAGIVGLINFISQFLVLIVIVIIKKISTGNLTFLVLILSIIPVVVLFLSSLVLFKTKLKYLQPSFKNLKFVYIKEVLNTGISFFVIQIGALVLYQTNNVIIIKIIGLEAVAEYNVSYKLFSLIAMIATIIATPYWSAFTDAYTKKDFKWMQSSAKFAKKIIFLLSLLALIMYLFSDKIYSLWLGKDFVVNENLSLVMMLYVIGFVWQSIHIYFINGIGKIKLQLILVVFFAIINIPLAIMLGKIYGLVGVVLANVIQVFFTGIIFSIQLNKIIFNKAFGIWGR